MLQKSGLASLLLLAGLLPAMAQDIDNAGALTRDEFRALSEDLGAALGYRALSPAEPLGVVGFDFAVDASVTRVANEGAWRVASGGEEITTLPMARLRFSKGLPLGFDLGGYYSGVPGGNIRSYGAELRYALVEGGVLTPALGLRAAASRLAGVDELEFDTRSLDLAISKGFGPVTPYGGVGRVWVASRYSGPRADLCIPESELLVCRGGAADFGQTRYFAGLRLSLLAFNLVLEGDRTGEATTYALKLGFGF